MKALFFRSPRATCSWSMGSIFFSIGSDSPVRAASSMRRLATSTRRPSAGIRFPASSSTTSPGTSSRAEISTTWPSRRTRTVGTASFFRAAIACSARYSWLTPSAALIKTMARMTIVSCASPIKADTMAATIKMNTMASVSCSRRMSQIDLTPLSISSLAPYRPRRVCASASARPAAISVSNCRAISSGEWRYHSAISQVSPCCLAGNYNMGVAPAASGAISGSEME